MNFQPTQTHRLRRAHTNLIKTLFAGAHAHILGATLVVGDKERKVDNQPNATDGLFVPQRLVICLSFRSHESLPPSHPRVIEDCGPRGLTLGGKEFTDRREKWRETLTRRMDANAQQESIRLTSLSLPLVGNCLSFPRSGGHSCRLVVCLAPVSCVRCPDRGRDSKRPRFS